MKNKNLLCYFFLSVIVACNSSPITENEEPGTSANSTGQAVETDQEKTKKDSLIIDAATLADAEVKYVLPSSTIILSSLGHITNVDWGKLSQFRTGPTYRDDYACAFNMGRAVANAVIAVKDRDKEKLETMNQEVFRLSEELHIEKNLSPKKKELEEAFENDNWQNLDRALNELLNTDMRDELEKNVNGKMVWVVSNLGGWMEGLSIVNQQYMNDPKEDVAELVYQPEIVGELSQMLTKLGDSFAQKEKVLTQLRKLEGLLKNQASQENSRNIQFTVKSIIQQFQ